MKKNFAQQAHSAFYSPSLGPQFLRISFVGLKSHVGLSQAMQRTSILTDYEKKRRLTKREAFDVVCSMNSGWILRILSEIQDVD